MSGPIEKNVYFFRFPCQPELKTSNLSSDNDLVTSDEYGWPFLCRLVESPHHMQYRSTKRMDHQVEAHIKAEPGSIDRRGKLDPTCKGRSEGESSA